MHILCNSETSCDTMQNIIDVNYKYDLCPKPLSLFTPIQTMFFFCIRGPENNIKAFHHHSASFCNIFHQFLA